MRLRIDSQVAPVLRRTTLREHPVLKDLEVIRFTQATNFRVTPEQDAVLRSLVTGLRMPVLRSEIEARVFLPRDWLEDALELLKEKGQIVFYGPPGTGKTFVALALADEITRDGGAFRVVQFHPSYSYEDFVGGFRPVEDDGAHGVRYQRTDGPLREIARDAAADPSRPYVLIVDEINRGNIPKIFGELLFLLEYRQKGVRLQYWPEQEFTLPANLFVIGTMNTADRSIALVDAALRRRFYFVEFAPTEEPVKWVLPKWLSAHQLGDDPARLLSLLNDEIADNDVAIGPAYFMTDAEAGPDLDRIWQRAIMPLLEEYFYGTKWDRDRFSLKRLRARLAGRGNRDADGRCGGRRISPLSPITMMAWSEKLAELTHEQAAQLSSLGLVDVLAEPASSAWRLRSNSRIGVASGPGWELRVSPKLRSRSCSSCWPTPRTRTDGKTSWPTSMSTTTSSTRSPAVSRGTRSARSNKVCCATTYDWRSD